MTTAFFHDHDERTACVLCGAPTHGRVRGELARYLVPVCGACFLAPSFDTEHVEIGETCNVRGYPISCKLP